MDRRLSTILAADIVGFSRDVGQNETRALDRLARLRTLVADQVEAENGRIFSTAGDGFMVEFPSPVGAVRAAHAIQLELKAPQMQRDIGFELRIGVHLADVVADGDDLLGDGVNIASRLEALADPGSVFLSRAVVECVKRVSYLKFEDLGEQRLKNISDPVSVFRIVGELERQSYETAGTAQEQLQDLKVQDLRDNAIVVVPFANASNNPDQDYFADGFTEDLITELSRFSDLMVISRNASLTLKGATMDAAELGGKFGARFCLEGSVRLLGPRVRISAYLVDAQTGQQIWADKDDCGIDALFDMQDKLVARIVASVALQVEELARGAARRKRPREMAAYDCLLRGMEFHRVGGVTQENALEALHWFDRALEIDPLYGQAHAWRACALATVSEWTGEDVWDELHRLGRRAVELDDTDAEIHRICGSLGLYSRDFDLALYHFNRALALNPNHAYIVGRMGEVHNFLGQGEKALEYQQRAKELDPFLPTYCRELEAVAHYVLGNDDACIRVARQISPKSRRAAVYSTAAAQRLGDRKTLLQEVDALLAIDPEFDPDAFVLTEFYKDRHYARQLASELKQALTVQFASA